MTSSDDLMKELAEALRDDVVVLRGMSHDLAGLMPQSAPLMKKLAEKREHLLARYDASRPEGKSEVSK